MTFSGKKIFAPVSNLSLLCSRARILSNLDRLTYIADGKFTFDFGKKNNPKRCPGSDLQFFSCVPFAGCRRDWHWPCSVFTRDSEWGWVVSDRGYGRCQWVVARLVAQHLIGIIPSRPDLPVDTTPGRSMPCLARPVPRLRSCGKCLALPLRPRSQLLDTGSLGPACAVASCSLASSASASDSGSFLGTICSRSCGDHDSIFRCPSSSYG